MTDPLGRFTRLEGKEVVSHKCVTPGCVYPQFTMGLCRACVSDKVRVESTVGSTAAMCVLAIPARSGLRRMVFLA